MESGGIMMIDAVAMAAVVLVAFVIMSACIAYGQHLGSKKLLLAKINSKEIILLKYSNLKGLKKKLMLDQQDMELLRKIKKIIPENFFTSIKLYSFSFAEADDHGYVPANIDFAIFDESGNLVGAILADSRLRSPEEKRYFSRQKQIIESLGIWVIEYANIPDDEKIKKDLEAVMKKNPQR